MRKRKKSKKKKKKKKKKMRQESPHDEKERIMRGGLVRKMTKVKNNLLG